MPQCAAQGTGMGSSAGAGRAQQDPEVETVKAEDCGFDLRGPLAGNHLR